MRMGQGPHQPPGFVGDIEIHPDLEPVQYFEHEPQRQEDEQGPPSEADVFFRVEEWVVCDVRQGVSRRLRPLLSQKEPPVVTDVEKCPHHVGPKGPVGIDEKLGLTTLSR